MASLSKIMPTTLLTIKSKKFNYHGTYKLTFTVRLKTCTFQNHPNESDHAPLKMAFSRSSDP
jgi:hypothetical protein